MAIVSWYCSLPNPVRLLAALGLAATLLPAQEPARLLEPRAAVRLLTGASATISYLLNEPPDEAIVLEIRDPSGALVSTLHPESDLPGMNKIEWDLRYQPAPAVELRTTPAENPHIWEESRFQGKQTRPVAHKGIDQAQFGPLAAPGRYTVVLQVNGKKYSQPIEVVLPPNSHGTDAEVQESVRLQLRIRDDIAAVAGMINRIEVARKEIEDQRKASPSAELDAADRKLQAVEYRMITPADTLSDEKYNSEAARLYLNLLWLNLSLGSGTGKYAGGADYAPTKTAIDLAKELEAELKSVQAEFKMVMVR